MPPEFGQLLNRCIEERTKARILHFRRRVKDPRREVAKFITWVEEQALAEPRKAFPLCALGIRLSAAVYSDCLSSRSFNVLAASHQYLGQVKKAKATLEIAVAHGKKCLACSAACLRFRSRFLLMSEDYEGALVAVNQALDASRELGDEDGAGKALLYRNYLNFQTNKLDLAIEDAENALKKIDPIKSPNFHSAALLNLAGTLAYGTQADAIRSLEMMPEVEAAFEGLRYRTLQRAAIKWVKGLLAVRAGYTAKGEGHLKSARTMLVQLELPEEVLAVTADLAVIAYPDRAAIRSLLRETLRLDLEWGDSRTLIEQAWESTRTENAFVEGDPDGKIREALKSLRESMNRDTIPPECLDYDSKDVDGDLLGFG